VSKETGGSSTPPRAEQGRIAEVVGRQRDALLATEEQLTTQIDRLCEYRQALVSAAVAGQVDLTAEAAA